MGKNLSFKKIGKQILSINNLIESNFNKIKYFKSNYKKILLNKDNRVFLGIAIATILTLSYFLIPTIYNKDRIQLQIKNQIFKNYNIDIKFNENINYGLIPRPHFYAKNLSILRNDKEIGNTKNLKVFIGIGDFFSINKIDIKDLSFNKTDFTFYIEDMIFFYELLKTEPNENEIIFKKSNIFFKNKKDEVLFINKIYNGKFYYDSNNLQNILSSKNEIFKVPFKFVVKNDKFNKKILTKFNSKKIRLNLNSNTNYDKDFIEGFLNILFINKDTSLNYILKKDSLSFSSESNKNSYSGSIDFKPFYLSANFKYEGLSTKGLFNDDSIFVDLINSEIIDNKNLSANLVLNAKDIININELNNLNLTISIEEGDINFSDSSIMWKDDLKIYFNESLLIKDDDGINFVGTAVLDFNDINNFYSSFQIKKINRSDIKQIKIDFIYNLNNKTVRFDNPKINNTQNTNLEEFLFKFNSKEERVFNKITFKNFINSFFSVYAG